MCSADCSYWCAPRIARHSRYCIPSKVRTESVPGHWSLTRPAIFTQRLRAEQSTIALPSAAEPYSNCLLRSRVGRSQPSTRLRARRMAGIRLRLSPSDPAACSMAQPLTVDSKVVVAPYFACSQFAATPRANSDSGPRLHSIAMANAMALEPTADSSSTTQETSTAPRSLCAASPGRSTNSSPAQGLQGLWRRTLVHAFAGPPTDGRWVLGTLLIDQSGNLYGPTYLGGSDDVGTIYRLSPQGNSWKEDLLHVFTGLTTIHPIGNLISDSSGNFYGIAHGDPSASIAFQLVNLNGSFVFTQLYTFLPGQAQSITSGLVMDSAGNLYGVGDGGAYSYGAIYKLSNTANGWSYSTLYDFTGGSDGSLPSGPLAIDASGNLYGSATAGGDPNCNNGAGCGTVWTIKVN